VNALLSWSTQILNMQISLAADRNQIAAPPKNMLVAIASGVENPELLVIVELGVQ
jgi:hypothetical protein